VTTNTLQPAIQTTGLEPLWLSELGPNPLVSVLMSVYNYGQYVGAAIRSVLNQTYANFELIICDDGSTDDSVSQIQKYLSDPRVRLFRKANGGQATGFNMAFENARGDIVTFLDADDVYTTRKLARIVEKIRNHPASGCVLNGSQFADEFLRPLGNLPLMAKLPSGWLASTALQSGGILPYMCGTPGMNMRREVAQAIFPLPTEQPFCRFPDMLLWRLLPLFAVISVIQEPLATIRLHGTNSYQQSRITAESLKRELDINEELWSELRRRLVTIDPGLGDLLAPPDASPSILLQSYMHARLTRSAERRAYHARLLASLHLEGAGRARRALWTAAPYLPVFIFERLINLLFTRNRWKALMAKSISGIRHRSSGAYRRRNSTK